MDLLLVMRSDWLTNIGEKKKKFPLFSTLGIEYWGNQISEVRPTAKFSE
jgi:hypothetical protein